MNKIDEYKIIQTQDSLKEFNETVNSEIDNSWQPFGSCTMNVIREESLCLRIYKKVKRRKYESKNN